MKFFQKILFFIFLFSFESVVTIELDEGVRQMMRRVAFFPVSNEDESGGVITLSTKTNYKLKENIEYPIVIDSDGVVLDLNGFEVAHDMADENVITINADKKEIFICNGRIANLDGVGDGSGILINAGASNIYMDTLKIFDCGTGVKLNGTFNFEVTECKLFSLNILSSTTGIECSYANNNIIENCNAIGSTEIGFAMQHCQVNCFEHCKALRTCGPATVAGFSSKNGSTNLLQNCVVKKTKTSGEVFCTKAYGILLTGTEEKTKIIDCIVNETDMTSTVSAVSYGIALDPVLLEGDDLLSLIDSENYGSSLYSLAWSSNGKFLAVGGQTPTNGDEIQVFSFNDSTFDLVAFENYGTSVRSLSWSPDGKYLAVAGFAPASGDEIQIFSFNGSILTLIDSENYGGGIFSLAWSPNGKHLAVGGETPTNNNEIQVFYFNGLTLDLVTSENYGTSVRSVAWSPNGKYLAVGGVAPASGDEIQIFSFNGSILDLVTSENYGSFVVSIAWSPNGSFLMAGGGSPISGDEIQIFSFNGSILNFVTSKNYGTSFNSAVWSPNGKFLIVGGATPASGDEIQIFSFNGSILNFVTSKNYGSSVLSVALSSDGKFLTAGGFGPANGNEIQVFSVMNSPINCLLKNNTVCDTAAFGQFVGTGIAGGGCNSFLNNACCNNEVPFTYGVPNVFYGDHNTPRPFNNIAMPIVL
ncbi:WD40 repeat domain-containing protein [bacterium]|nr:WD40 repeat domain-containing protein [bacterium]